MVIESHWIWNGRMCKKPVKYNPFVCIIFVLINDLFNQVLSVYFYNVCAIIVVNQYV